jgi:hypothetical protein
VALLQDDERFEHRAGLAPEQRFVVGLEQFVAAVKVLVDFFAAAAARREDQRAEVLQHDRVQLADLDCRAVKALHQVLARAAVRGVAQAHLGRERGLHVEHQAFFAALREVMQADAQILQEGFVLAQQ